MTDETYKALKGACARIVAGTSKGSGYLVARDRVVTCAHVVKPVGEGGKATVTFPSTELEATILKLDETSDAAVLTLSSPLDDLAPLKLAGGVDRKAPWEGYGFPDLTKGEGIPLEGAVMDPDSKDDQKTPVLLLRSEQIAAGEGASLHGFSGSPVLVDGLVVGHLKRYIKDKESPLRPAYGYVYATPSRAVLQLLGAQQAVAVIQAPEPLFPTTSLPSLREDEYHVFISYRSTDRKWAMQLVSRLEGVGFKIFIDQRELIPGDPLANKLQSALVRSKSAVVMISSGWLESRWCQEESNVLLNRTIEDPSFRVVPIRLDQSTLPAMWQGRLWMDFSGTDGPEGAEFRRLQYALLGRVPPAEDSTENQVFKAESDATDELIRDIRAASAVPKSADNSTDMRRDIRAASAAGAQRVFALWTRWQQAGMPDGPASLLVAQSLISLGYPEQALKVLTVSHRGVDADRLHALALAKTGKTNDALEILVRLYESGQLDAETGGILGGRYKEKWLESGKTDTAPLQTAFRIYLETFERTGDSYPGINAAAMALQLKDRAQSVEIALKVRTQLEGRLIQDLDHWQLATVGEAYLLLCDLDKVKHLEKAKEWYGKAVTKCAGAHQDIAVMRRQARRTLETMGLPKNELDFILDVPRVAAFTGHMVDAPGRNSPRFPSEKVGAVRKAMQERLQKFEIGYGFSSAARGSDLIFIEELLKRDGCARVFLPFPRETFKRTSVGHGWDGRFDEALGNQDKVEIIELSQDVPSEDKQPEAYASCNWKVFKEAIAKAKLLDEEPLLIAVWNGNPGDGTGGTADAVREWQNEGHPVEIIDISKL